jgi:hypothetical protein
MSGRDGVDLNYLFHRQQVERSRARAARTPEAREAHEELAHRYEEQIERLTAEEFNIRPDGDVGALKAPATH